MEEKSQNKKKTRKRGIDYVTTAIILLAIALFALALFIITNRKETRTTVDKTDVTMGALDCKSSNPADPFFVSNGATNVIHEVKVTLKNDAVDKLSYNYYADYESEDRANTARSELHADYNKYMGANNVQHESLSPTFNYDGNKVKVNLFAERGKSLNSTSARLFFLSSEELSELSNYSGSDLEKIYVGKGFDCTFSQ